MLWFKSKQQIEKEFGGKVDTEIRLALFRWLQMLDAGDDIKVADEMRRMLATPKRPT